jgi:hypothetical protein
MSIIFQNCDKFISVTEVPSMKYVYKELVQTFSWETCDKGMS